MKIGINLSGVYYDDGSKYRYRNYEESINEFNQYIVEPLKKQGHDVVFYIYSYNTSKVNNIKKSFQPLIKSKFIDEHNQILIPGTSVQNTNLICGLRDMLGEKIDVIIRARFDQKFMMNPFEVYDWDFNKFNFLWREPEMHDLPLVNDTFFIFPSNMLTDVIDSLLECELNPYKNIKVALHNLYWPIVNRVGIENVKILDDRFVTKEMNELYTLTRHE